MSNNYWDDEDDDDTQPEGQLSDGDLLKKLRKAKRSDEKRIKELTEQLESLSKVQKERTVKEILDKKGVNQKAARFILNEVPDASEEAINAWLEDNGDLFGFTADEQQARPDAANLAALRQQDIITEGAMTPDKMEDLNMKLDNFGSQDELINFLRSQS
jgi:hypothetical protein